MVGKPKGVGKPTLTSLTKEFLDKPFQAGGQGEVGFDCLGLVYSVLKKMGKQNVPTSFGKWTLENYQKLYMENPDEAERLLVELAESVGVPIAVHERTAGDVMVVRNAQGHLFPAIYVGNNQILASFSDAGVRVISLSDTVRPYMVRRFS